MAASLIAGDAVAERTKRTRRCHPKVRTGCVTCKIRRKKCDETKPFCHRCTSTGRKCDGYPDQDESAAGLLSPPTSTPSTPVPPYNRGDDLVSSASLGLSFDDPTPTWNLSQPRNSLQLWRPPALSLFATDKDYFCFDFFQNRTGPEFSGYFDSPFWQGFLIQMCFSHPAVRQAAVALGAVHRRVELGITPEAFEYCAFALRSYYKATRLLREDLQDSPLDKMEINMLVSLLLAAFETFQCNYGAATEHMLGGLKTIFIRKLHKRSSRSQRRDAVLNEKNLRDLFTRLETRSAVFFKRPPQIDPEPGNDGGVPEIPTQFATLEDARDCLFTLVHWLLHALAHEERDESGRFSSHREYVVRLLQWSWAYAAFSRAARKTSSPIGSSGLHEQPYRVLRTYREAAYLLLLAQPDLDPVTDLFRPEATIDNGLVCYSPSERRQAMNANFNKLLAQADGQLDMPVLMTGFVPGKTHSYNFDSGIGPPLYFAPHIGSPTKIRPQTASLLPRSTQHDYFMKSMGAYSAAEKLTSMEEEAVLACGALPAGVDAKWVDVTCFLEEKKVLMRYCTQDTLGDGLIWTEEWLTY